MNTKQVLEGALELLEQGWTKGAYARNVDGKPTMPSSPDTRSYCVRGALYCVAQEPLAHLLALRALQDSVGERLITWNDNPETTFSDVRTAFRRAIGSRSVSAAEETIPVAA